MARFDLPKPGERVDRYEVLAEVARGGMAAVFAVRRRGAGGFDKLLALKVLLAHLAAERKFVDMFLDEARLAAQIQHPHVVATFDVGEYNELPFLVMEFLSGRPLQTIAKKSVERNGPAPLGCYCRMLADAAEGLAGVHEARAADGKPLDAMHRDVTPRNIHVGYDGQVKLVDFGISAARGRISSTRSGEVKGTLSYLAPEQITRTRHLDKSIDLWSLGVVCWEVLSGRRLFHGDDEAATLWNIMHAEIPSLQREQSDLPDPLARAVTQCLERDPAKRPLSSRALAEELRRAAAAMGCAGQTELSAWIQDLLCEERTEDERRMSAWLGPEPAVDQSSPSADPSAVRTRALGGARATRRVRTWLMFALIGGAAATAWWSLRDAADGARSDGRTGPERQTPASVTALVPMASDATRIGSDGAGPPATDIKDAGEDGTIAPVPDASTSHDRPRRKLHNPAPRESNSDAADRTRSPLLHPPWEP